MQAIAPDAAIIAATGSHEDGRLTDQHTFAL